MSPVAASSGQRVATRLHSRNGQPPPMLSLKRALIGLVATVAITTLTVGGLGVVTHDSHFGVEAASLQAPHRPHVSARWLDAHRVRLTWQAPPSGDTARVTGYRVTRNGTDRQGRGPLRTVVPATRHALTISGLRSRVRYTFTVAARSRAGLGRLTRVTVPSAVATGTSGTAAAVTGAPGTPAIISSSAGDHAVTVDWAPPTTSGSSAVTGYRVARNGTDTEGKGPWSTLVPATQRTFTMTLLTNGTPYTVSVAAVNAAGAGAPGGVVLVPGLPGGQPPAGPAARP